MLAPGSQPISLLRDVVNEDVGVNGIGGSDERVEETPAPDSCGKACIVESCHRVGKSNGLGVASGRR